MHLSLVIVLTMTAVCSCNLWDNIFSHTLAPTPILLSESLNFDFKVPQYNNMKANIDFNQQLQLITIDVGYSILTLRVSVARLEINLHNLVISSKSTLTDTCQKYQLQSLQKVQLKNVSISKQKLFLVNLFFKYLGETKPKFMLEEKYAIYEFQPYILGEAKLDEVTANIDQISKSDLDLDAYLFVYVDRKNGSLKKIIQGKNQEQEIPFQTISKVKKGMECQGDIKALTEDSLREFVKNAVEDYQDQEKEKENQEDTQN